MSKSVRIEYLGFDWRMKITLISYSIIAFLKLLVYILTGFLVMLAEFLHNLIDIFILITVIYTKRLAEKPPDYTHPLGHGLIQNVGGVMVSVVFITVVAFELVREGIEKIVSPTIGKFPELAILVLIFGLFSSLILYRIFEKDSVAEKVTKVELLNDVLANFGALSGVLFSLVGYPVADGIFTIFIALLICRNGYRLFKENVSYLLGKSPSGEFYERVVRIVKEFPEVLDVHDVIAIYIGENALHVDMHVTVREDMTVKEADELTKKIAKVLMDKIPDIKYVLIHVCAEKGRYVRTTANRVMGKL